MHMGFSPYQKVVIVVALKLLAGAVTLTAISRENDR